MGGGSSLPPHFNPKRGETFRLFSSFQDYEGRGKRQLSSDRVPVPAPQTKSGAARRPPSRTGAAGRGGRTATAEQRPRAAPTATAALRGTRAGRARRGAAAVTPCPSGAPHVPFLLFIVPARTAALREARRDAAPLLNSATRRRAAKKRGQTAGPGPRRCQGAAGFRLPGGFPAAAGSLRLCSFLVKVGEGTGGKGARGRPPPSRSD